MFCPKCGNKLPDEANFCAKCGNSLHSKNQILNTNKQNNNQNNSDTQKINFFTNNKKLLFVFCGIGLAVIILIVLFICLNNSGVNKSNDVSENKSNNNITKQPENGFVKGAGPILIEGDFQTSFKLFQYDINNGSKKEIFNFANPNNGNVVVGGSYKKYISTIKDDRNLTYRSYFCKQLFSDDLSKYAITWYENDNSSHVGWIDKSNNVTDVTKNIHPSGNDFSSKLPKDSNPIFTPNGKFMFYDGVSEKYCFINVSNFKVEKEITKAQKEEIINVLTTAVFVGSEGDVVGVNNDSCSHFHLGSRVVHSCSRNSGVYAEDIYNGYIYGNGKDPSSKNNYIGKFNGTEFTNESGFYTTSSPYIASVRGGFDSNGTERVRPIKISPDTDYFIQNCCCYNGKIAFTANRGSEYSLFLMNDSGQNEPKIITSYDSKQRLLFWL